MANKDATYRRLLPPFGADKTGHEAPSGWPTMAGHPLEPATYLAKFGALMCAVIVLNRLLAIAFDYFGF